MENPKKKKDESFITTLIFGLIAVSFIATSFRGGGGFWEPAVITLGNHKIGVKEFQKAYRERIGALKKMYGQNSRELMDHLVKDIIRDKVINLELDKLGIRVSEQMAAAFLKKNPTFSNEQGEFDDKKFQQFIKNSGLREKEFLGEEQKRLAKHFFSEAMKGQIDAPKVLDDLMCKGFFQKRYGVYKPFNYEEASVSSTEPSEQELKQIYAQTKPSAPEYRLAKVIRISPMLIAQKMEVSDKEVAEFYKKHDFPLPLDQMKDRITEQIKKEKSRIKVAELIDNIDDAIGGGETLQTISKKFDLPLLSVTVSSKGFTPEGIVSPILNFAELKTQAEDLRYFMLEKIFSSDVNQDPQLFQMPSVEACFIQVEKIIPPKELTYNEAQNQLKKIWEKNKSEDAALQGANTFLEKLRKTPISGWEKMSGIKTLPAFSSQSMDKETPKAVQFAVFSLKPGTAVIVPSKKGIYVVGLEKIEQPTMNELPGQEKDNLHYLVKNDLQKTFWTVFCNTLNHQYPTQINFSYIEKMLKLQSKE